MTLLPFWQLETWLSGRKRRFAKSVMGSNPSAGSNPVVSARSDVRCRKPFDNGHLR